MKAKLASSRGPSAPSAPAHVRTGSGHSVTASETGDERFLFSALSLQAMIINCSKMRVAWVMAWVVGCLLLARPAAPTVRSLQLSPTPGSYSLGAQIVCDGDAADAPLVAWRRIDV